MQTCNFQVWSCIYRKFCDQLQSPAKVTIFKNNDRSLLPVVWRPGNFEVKISAEDSADFLRDHVEEAVSDTDNLKVVHCHQNNDPTLPMQMMVEIKLNSKNVPPDGFELIHEPNVWLRNRLFMVSGEKWSRRDFPIIRI